MDANLFKNLVNLNELNLSDNDIIQIDRFAFNRMENLEIRRLGGNKLTQLDSNIFLGLSNLNYLDLMKNEISDLPDFVFKDLENLVYLNLNENKLTKINSKSLYNHSIKI